MSEAPTVSDATTDEPQVTSAGVAPPIAASSTISPSEPPTPADASPSTGSPEDTAEPKPRPRPKPDPPRWTTLECETIRTRAAEDRVARRWQALLDGVTRGRKCWRDDDERLLLRLTALNGLGRHEECVRLGASSLERQIQRITAQCRDELAKPPP